MLITRRVFAKKRSHKKLKIRTSKQSLGALLIASGVALVSLNPLIDQYQNLFLDNPQSSEMNGNVSGYNDSVVETPLENQASLPQRIQIQRVKIDLPVAKAKVIDGSWEVFEEKAGYGDGTSLPGEKGNMVIFAHARVSQFYPLKSVKIGDEILVFAQDQKYSYKITEIKSVFPSDLSVIKETEEEILTLFTCSGYADTKRLVVTAKRF